MTFYLHAWALNNQVGFVVCPTIMARSMPEFSGVSQKRKRADSADVEMIKAELRAEVTQDILCMLVS